MKWLILLLPLASFAQCEVVNVTLPFTETICFENGDCNFVQNNYPISHPTYGCWTCLNNPTYYVITPAVDTYVTLDIVPDLNSHLPSNAEPQVAGFILFDGCPNNGGETLLRPWTYSGGACWDWAIMDIYCGWSQSVNAPNLNQGCVTSTPTYTGFAHTVTMGFELQGGNEYWFCIFPQGGCPPFTSTCTWGCIDVSFSGLTFLELVSTPPPPLSTPPKSVNAPPRFEKVVHQSYGFLLREVASGEYYDLRLRRVF